MGNPITVLFVEDDTYVLASQTEALSEFGFRVLPADNGFEALQILQHEPVDVLVTDIIMPGVNGIELAEQAKAMKPDLQIVLITGSLSIADLANTVGKVMVKPLAPSDIAYQIRAMTAVH